MNTLEIECLSAGSAGILNLLGLSFTSPHSTGQRREVENGRECRKKVEDKMQEPNWTREKENAGLAC